MGTSYPWSHEKKLKIRDDESEYLDQPSAAPKKKQSKKFCKKLKGPHNFVPFERPKSYWFTGKKLWNEFRCTGCGKQRLEFFDNWLDKFK